MTCEDETMRIIFYNIKDNVFLLKTYDNIVNHINIKTMKDGAILRKALSDKSIEILNYVPIKKKQEAIKEQFKSAITYLGNSIDKNRIRTIYDISEIKQDDIYIAWYYFPSHMKILKDLKCKKVVMGQHFILLPFNGDFSSMGVNWFVNQIDVSKNEFINYFFNLKNVNIMTLPYTFENRFKCKRDFRERKEKALSIGTISTVNGKGYDIYIEYMNDICLQPMRKIIYEKGSNKYIDVYNNFLFTMGYNNEINIHSKFSDYIKGKISDWKEAGQTKYYTFDMVEKYNEYMMCVCGEEKVGLPGIGFVECMACGCAYIGLDHEMYTSLGLIPGIHYITYDGTYDDLINVIQYYQNNVDELEKIAIQGRKYILKNFNRDVVMNKFFEKLKCLGEE